MSATAIFDLELRLDIVGGAAAEQRFWIELSKRMQMVVGTLDEDVWYTWLNGEWTRVPPEKLVQDYAPDGKAHLFVLAGTIQCFVRPKGGT